MMDQNQDFTPLEQSQETLQNTAQSDPQEQQAASGPDRVPQGNDPSYDAATPRNEFDYGTQPNYYNYNHTPAAPEKSYPNGYAIASLILGIVSIVLCCCGCITIVTSALAIVFAILSRQGQPMRGNAIAGLICGITGLVLALVMLFSAIAAIATNDSSDFEDFYYDFYGEESFENTYPSSQGNGYTVE
jgi:hypothetical protein